MTTKNLPHQLSDSDDDLDIGLDSEDDIKPVVVPMAGKVGKNAQQSGKPASLEDEGKCRI
jgi:hypothetical protein